MPVNTLHIASMGDDDIISDKRVVANNLDNTIEYAKNCIVAGGKVNVGVSEICYTLFRGKLTTCFAGNEMQLML